MGESRRGWAGDGERIAAPRARCYPPAVFRFALLTALVWGTPLVALGQGPDAQVPDEFADDDAFDALGEPDPPAPPATPAPPSQPAPPAEDGFDEFADPAPETPPAAPSDAGDAPPPEDGERMRMLVVDAATFGIDPVVGRVASATMRETAADMGYRVLTPEETVAAAQQLRMPYPPTPADLWRVSWVARVHRGAFARVWAHAGQYVVEISVASLDGAGPFFARGTAGADDLRAVIERLMRNALPPPSAWNVTGAQAVDRAAAGEPEAPVDELDGSTAPTDPEPPEEPEPEAELRRWSLTLQTESAFGASQEFFYNHLIGARLDFRITRTILLGAYVAYANLNGRDGRSDNLLFMLQFENRIVLSNELDLTIPLRGAVGYLPFNGPVIRLAAGLNLALSPQWEIGADLLVPTFWFIPGRTIISLDVGLEATYRF